MTPVQELVWAPALVVPAGALEQVRERPDGAAVPGGGYTTVHHMTAWCCETDSVNRHPYVLYILMHKPCIPEPFTYLFRLFSCRAGQA